MNIWFHLLFGGVAVLFFLWEYWRRRRMYQLVFACWVASTFLTYVSDAKAFQMGLGIIELVFCVVALGTLWHARRMDAKKQTATQTNESKE